jgi:anti-sigma regulatory factor (Ser/Thr protein kinase)
MPDYSSRKVPRMEPKTQAAEVNEFCLVLTPTSSAAVRARDAVRERFGGLTDETRGDLAAVVAELVNNSVEHGPGKPITVTVVLGADAIHGEGSDQGNPLVMSPPISNGGGSDGNGLALVDRLTSRWAIHEGSTDIWFEIPLAR